MPKSIYERIGTVPRKGDWVQDIDNVFRPNYVTRALGKGWTEVEGVSGAGVVKRWHYKPNTLRVFKRIGKRRVKRG